MEAFDDKKFELNLKMKIHWKKHMLGLNALHRAINVGDKEVIKKAIESHYQHLRAIYQLCKLE